MLAPNSPRTVNVALVGCGNFAQQQHLPNLARLPSANLSTLCDLDEDLLKNLSTKFEVPAITTSYDEILKNEDIEAVVLVVRHQLHVDYVVKALEAGKHVYVEKPLASSEEDCQRLEQLSPELAAKAVVGFNKRFSPAYQMARKVMVADGGPRNLHLRMADDAWRWAKGYDPGYLMLIDVCHLFDLLRWLTVSEPNSIACASARSDDDAFLVTMENGAVATIMLSAHGTMDMPKERLEVICDRGGVSVEDHAEVRTYGYSNFEPRYTFAGHRHPKLGLLSEQLLAIQGADAMSSVRRALWTLRQELEGGKLSKGEERDIRQFTDEVIPNFLRDQGWKACMTAFIAKVANDGPSDHATPKDAIVARRMLDAALKSQHSRNTVQL